MFDSLWLTQIPYDWAALLIRLAICCALIPYGYSKFKGRKAADKFLKIWIIPPALAYYLAMFAEVIGSVCVILGLFTRLFALICFCNMCVATYADYAIEKVKDARSEAAVYAYAFFAILWIGPGNFSLDYLIFHF